MSSITFRSYSEEDLPAPVAAETPDWYRRVPANVDGVATVRQCSPFLDALETGYLLRLPFDVHVDEQAEGPVFTCPAAPWATPKRHGTAQLPQFAPVYKFVAAWAAVVGEGHSCLYTHPLNRHDLPFRTFSGVVDGGYGSPVNFPFAWLGGAELLEAGTPIASVIPFLREEWEATVEFVPEAELERDAVEVRRHLHGYRNLFRKPKLWRKPCRSKS